jgi:hypothetical protein
MSSISFVIAINLMLLGQNEFMSRVKNVQQKQQTMSSSSPNMSVQQVRQAQQQMIEEGKSIYLSIYRSIYLSIYLFIYLLIYITIYLFI